MGRQSAPAVSGLKITDAKGFHVTFANGHTVSVQFGPGNYSDNYNLSFSQHLSKRADLSSATAEVAAWGPGGNWHHLGDGDDVVGYVKPDDILAILVRIAALPGEKAEGRADG